ncbi:MAG: DUF3365 domain-containing protein [Verrucomicrobiaceae bacterium]|nr:DUF3365 domain-containing protein [Verrucomicrobiaceae bacterium]
MKAHPVRKYGLILLAFCFASSTLWVSGEPAAAEGKEGKQAVEQTPEEEEAAAEARKEARKQISLPDTVEEARARARWLHEGLHGALQVMHRDFFEEDDAGMLPSQSLDDVFKEMARSWAVEIRWLGVNATKGIDHKPKDRFEERAAAALMDGEIEYEQIEANRYRYVGLVRLQNECLKCHVRERTTLEDRVGGLAISFPMKKKTE